MPCASGSAEGERKVSGRPRARESDERTARPIASACCRSRRWRVDAAAQQPRDNQRRAASGTSTITGVVMSAEAQARPLRRARVTISGSELEVIDEPRSRPTTAGSRSIHCRREAFTVSASKDGYTPAAFGAVRPGRPGRLVTLAAGEVRQVAVGTSAGRGHHRHGA